MATYFNLPGSQTITGTNVQDRFYAFTSSQNFNDVRADTITISFSWTSAIRTSATSFFTIVGSNIQTSSDFFAGAENNDFIYGSSLNDALFYNNGVISGGIGSFSSIEQIEMGAGDDIVDLSAHGANGVDYGKNIIIHGDAGNDIIIGGAGIDTLYGDDGNDLIFGYRGADTLYGGAGNDTLYGDDLGFNGIAGDDLLYGQAGDDILYGGARTDRLEGGDGNDILYGGAGGDNLFGGADNDILYGDDSGIAGNDKLNGDAGNDQLFGGDGADELRGGTGDDLLDGGTGNDFLIGDAGADTLIGQGGDDSIDGAGDIDTAVFSGNAADYSIVLNTDGSFTITDRRAGAPDGSDTVRNVEFFQFANGTVAAGQLNNPPVITSNGGGASASLSIAENTVSVTTVAAIDSDTGQVVTYSIGGGADAALFTIDAQTGLLSFIAAPNYEAPADANHDNIYDVIVRAADNAGGYDDQSLLITVTDAPDGFAPVISSNGGGATATLSVAENSTIVTTVQAADQDSPVISFSITGGADAALFSIDAQTGVLTFKNAPDFEMPADADHNNIYDVTVQASDGTNFDQQAIAVQIANLNDNGPVITSSGGGSTATVIAAEGAVSAVIVTAVDADGTAPVFSIVGGADAALFSIDVQTGALVFVTAPDFEMPGDANGNNIYEVVVQASDGTNVAQQALSILVENRNDNAPVILSGGGGATANVTVAENQSAVTIITASDADGTAPVFSIVGGADASLFSIDAQTGALVFNAPPDFEVPADADLNNIYDVIVRASDGSFFDDQQLAVTVTDVNEGGRTITGSSGNNIISPSATNPAYQTTALNDTIFALAGNDTIDGGLGADRMEGGTGNDIYFVDMFSNDGISSNDDLVIELANEGTDLVNSSVSYILTANVENLTLIGSAAINGAGNDLDNIITGNDAANILTGGIGNDRLDGKGGNDTLLGGVGDDRLDGGTGADILDGGANNDIYFVDVFSNDGISSNDDQIIELAGGGTDIANASVSYTLANEVENLTLTGTDAINGTGNVLANLINGNAAANSLAGADGDDTINGNAGVDTLLGGNGDDNLNGGADNDALFGEVGNDTLSGGAGNDSLDGGLGVDTLNGQAGDDVLFGGQGKDTLVGGTESDTFRFNLGDTTLNANTFDRINDFATGVDKVDLDSVTGPINPAAYAEAAIATNLFSDALTSAAGLISGKDAVFIAGTTDGWLLWDANHDGTIDQSILLKGLSSLSAFTSSDIL
jgi:Ca2+-binding RTX toxin-like protein